MNDLGENVMESVSNQDKVNNGKRITVMIGGKEMRMELYFVE